MVNAPDRVGVFVAMLLLAAASGCSPPREGSRPYDGYLPGTAPENVSVTIVRDAVTGAPLAGVTLRQYLETIDPRTPRAPLLAESTTDEFGIVSVTWTGEMQDCHWVFEKPGCAVTENYGFMADREVELVRGRALHGVLNDAFGRPYGGVGVELFLGCGHSPAVRHAVTDDEGRFCLRDVEPGMGTLWNPADGITADYEDATRGTRDRPLVITPDPGRVVTGRVVDEGGRPIVDAVIRGRQEFRGPVARTSGDGRFRLTGVAPSQAFLVHGPEGGYAYVDGRAIDPDRALTVVLRADEENDGRPDWKAEMVPLRFDVVDADSGASVSDARVSLHRPEDGWVFWADLADEETLDAPPGKYELRVGDAFASHVAAPRPFTVEAGDPALHRVEAHVQPTLALEVNGFPSDHGDLDLVLAGGVLVIPRGDESAPVHLPPTAEAVVRATAEDLVRYYPVGPLESGRRRARVDWPATKRVRVESGDFDTLSLLEQWSVQTDERTLATHATGRLTLLVDDDALGRRELPIDILGRAGAEVRVALDASEAPGLLTVRLPDGIPASGCNARIAGERFTLDEQGALTDWAVRPGAAVVVQATGHADLRRTLGSSPPYRLEWGQATLEVEVPEAPDFIVYIDGDIFGGEKGRVRVAGLEAGPHTVIVAAPGRRGQFLETELGAQESKALLVSLPPE